MGDVRVFIGDREIPNEFLQIDSRQHTIKLIDIVETAVTVEQMAAHRERLAQWLRDNDIDPDHVAADHSITVERTAHGRGIIRYSVFVCNEYGQRYVRPGEDRAATEQRTTALTVPLPDLGA